MEDLSLETKNSTDSDNAKKLAVLLQEHNGQDISVLDLRGLNNWTDFFIIATVTSKTHMDGLERHVKEFCHVSEIDVLGCSQTKSLRTRGLQKNTEDEWRLIDLGSIIIHLMISGTREFYDLDRLWAR
ncbi:MAG: ribosome silencing factor [Treponema sp.]|nr:ribosome silencing factor [Treponema sp.]